MATRSTIENHPSKDKIIELLLDGKSLRSVGRAVSPPVSHTALFRYKRNRIASAVKNAGVIANTLNPIGLAIPNPGSKGHSTLSESATMLALQHEPILQRIAAKYERFDKAFNSPDYQLKADLENAEIQALRFEAQLRQIGGFGLDKEASTGRTHVQIVLPATREQSADEGIVIDMGAERR